MSTKSKARIARRIGYGREYRLIRRVAKPMVALRQCVLAWDMSRKDVSGYPYIVDGPTVQTVTRGGYCVITGQGQYASVGRMRRRAMTYLALTMGRV